MDPRRICSFTQPLVAGLTCPGSLAKGLNPGQAAGVRPDKDYCNSG